MVSHIRVRRHLLVAQAVTRCAIIEPPRTFPQCGVHRYVSEALAA